MAFGVPQAQSGPKMTTARGYAGTEFPQFQSAGIIGLSANGDGKKSSFFNNPLFFPLLRNPLEFFASKNAPSPPMNHLPFMAAGPLWPRDSNQSPV